MTCIFVVLALVLCVYCFYSIDLKLKELSYAPDKLEFGALGTGWVYGLDLLSACFVGLLFSIISMQLQENKAMKYISIGAVAVEGILLIISIFMFFI